MKTNARPKFQPQLSVMRLFKALGLGLSCLILTACPAGKQTSNEAVASNSSAPHKVIIRGSNTIGEELAPRLIADFKSAHPSAEFELEAKATGYGIAALRAGQCDIAAASRSAIAEEQELAKEAKLEMNEHILGAYSIAIVVNPSNPATNLTKQQVQDIFTGKIQNWKDVGGPDAAITIYIRDPISGTHLGFKEIAMNNADYAPHPKLLTNYTAIVSAVAADANGIGYSAIEMAHSGGAKLLSIGGVAASSDTVHSGKYPYTRLLRFYTNKDHETQPTKDFIQFVLAPQGQAILTHMGFTPKP